MEEQRLSTDAKLVIVSTLKKPEFLASTTRSVAVQNLGARLLDLTETDVTCTSVFKKFSDYLVDTLRKNFRSAGRFRSRAAQREHLWTAFHRQSVKELPSKWKELYAALNIVDMAENLFHSTVNITVYEQLLRETCPAQRSPMVSIEAQLSKDELNALRYASGYVPMKILKKNEKKGRERKKEVME